MQRLRVSPRADWRTRVREHGFDFAEFADPETGAPTPYWVEDACYEFSSAAIDRLESATNELHAMCLDAVDEIVAQGDYAAFGLSEAEASLIERSHALKEPHLYGRMDLCFDGRNAPKLLEYNADTPTSLLESSVVQWFWLEDRGESGFDQFNSIHEALIARWPHVIGPNPGMIHFATFQESLEDHCNCEYLRDTCIQAGATETIALDIGDIGFDRNCFTDLEHREITRIFKLYPWEWMLAEEFGTHLLTTRTRWIEPPWKRLLADKAILVWLWNKHRGHPNLLPASHRPGDLPGECVFKPCLEREGEGVCFLNSPDAVGHAPTVRGMYQASQRLPVFSGRHAVVGSWIIGDVAAGIGIREDVGPITRNTSCFVPHRFR
ncbi:glutathionylspermidine synthase family protein [Ahniella affigens]|uniref:Glutathionylspermidine synthase family protein n=1 Tax=Ahniella affigens TaxID=2021234 RepID=A0A2P1PMG7_9GAMM|nr:glutathionylspermidine synthase family protein [Ahniella affigens]AVP96036.1 glutathionylspermidine synthase family protein [Ahniella affigens]